MGRLRVRTLSCGLCCFRRARRAGGEADGRGNCRVLRRRVAVVPQHVRTIDVPEDTSRVGARWLSEYHRQPVQVAGAGSVDDCQRLLRHPGLRRCAAARCGFRMAQRSAAAGSGCAERCCQLGCGAGLRPQQRRWHRHLLAGGPVAEEPSAGLGHPDRWAIGTHVLQPEVVSCKPRRVQDFCFVALRLGCRERHDLRVESIEQHRCCLAGPGWRLHRLRPAVCGCTTCGRARGGCRPGREAVGGRVLGTRLLGSEHRGLPRRQLFLPRAVRRLSVLGRHPGTGCYRGCCVLGRPCAEPVSWAAAGLRRADEHLRCTGEHRRGDAAARLPAV